MAKKRLNTTFLLGGLGLLLLAGAAVGTVLVLGRTSAAENVRRAEKLSAEGDWDAAIGQYGIALGKVRTDPKVWTAYGDAVGRVVYKDEDGSMFHQVRYAYDQALQVDPSYAPAMERQLNLLEEWADSFGADAAAYRAIHDLAERVVAVEPDNVAARTAVASSTIQETMQPGVDLPAETVDAAVASLRKQLDAGVADPDVPYFIALAKLDRATKLRSDGKADAAAALVKEVDGLFAPLLAERPDDAGLNFRAALIDGQLAGFTDDAAAKKAYQDRIKQRLSAAADHADPAKDGDLYENIVLGAAGQFERDGDLPRAEKMYRALVKLKPYDVIARIALGTLLSRKGEAGRDEAIKLLADETPMPPGLPPVEAVRERQSNVDRLASLADQRIRAAAALPAAPESAARRKQLLADAQGDIAKLQIKFAENPVTLRLVGELHRVKGENVEAVQVLNRALSLAGTSDSPSQRRVRYETMFSLAQADLALNQGGDARRLLSELAAPDGANYAPARRLLIALLLKERDFDTAREQVDVMAAQEPNDPSTLALRLAAYADDPAGLDKIFAGIPDATEQERRLKLQLAVMNPALRKTDAALSLAERLSAEAPADEAVARAHFLLLIDRKRQADAVAVLEKVVAANPKATASQSLLENLRKSPEQMKQTVQDRIAGLPEYDQAIARAQVAFSKNDPDGFVKSLDKAIATGKDNGQASATLLNYYLSAGKADRAAEYLPLVAKANYDQVGGRTFEVRLLAAQGKPERALSVAQGLVKDYGELAGSYLALGQAYQALGNAGQAAEAFARVVQDQPTNTDALRGLVRAYITTGRPAEAKRYIDQGERVAPADESFKSLALNWQLMYGDPAKAIDPLDEAVKANPDDAERWAMLGTAYLRAFQITREKKPDEAKSYADKGLDTVKRAMARFPDDPRIVPLFADLSNASGDPAAGAAALADLAALPAFADDVEVANMRARFLIGTGKPADAAAVYQQFLGKNPGAASVRVNLADLERGLGKPEAALAAVPADNADAAVRTKRIELLVNLGRKEEASKLVADALGKNRTPTLLNLAALVALQNGRPDQARGYVDESLKLSPNNPDALVRRAQVKLLGKPSDPQGAAADLTAARDARPDDIQARVMLAQVQSSLGNLSAASDELETALKATPGNKDLRLALARLYAGQNPPQYDEAERVLREAATDPSLGLTKDPDVASAQAEVFAAGGKSADAVAASRRAVALVPGNPTYFSALLNVLLNTGQNRAVLDETAKIDPKNGLPWWASAARGAAQAKLKNSAAAREEFAAAVKTAKGQNDVNAVGRVVQAAAGSIGPDAAVALVSDLVEADPQWKLRAAQVYQTAGDSDKAADLADEVVEVKGVDPQVRDSALLTLGSIDLTSVPPRLDRAIKSFREVVKHRPNDLSLLNNLADALATPGPFSDPKEALIYSQKAYDLVRGSDAPLASVLDTQGWVLVLNGQVADGLDLIRQASDRQPEAAIFYHLGEAYLRNKQPREAVDALRRAADAQQKAVAAGAPEDEALRQRIQTSTENARNAQARPG